MGRPKGSKNSFPGNPLSPAANGGPDGPPATVQTPGLKDDLSKLREELNVNLEEKTAGAKVPKRTQRKLAEEAAAREEQAAAIRKTAEGFAVIVGMGLEFLAKRMPNPIPATPEEKQAINEAVTGVVVKYIPTIDKWKEEILLGGTLLMFAIPRIQRSREQVNQAVIDYRAELERVTRGEKPNAAGIGEKP